MTNTPSNTFLDELGLGDVTGEERDELLAEAGEVIYNAVMLRVYDVLAHAQQTECTTLLQAQADDPDNVEKAEAVAAFLDRYVPDFARYVQEETDALQKRIRDTG